VTDDGLVKITAIEAIPFEIPFRRPFAFASGVATVADHVLVSVRTDEGIVGYAEAPPRPYTYGESQVSIRLSLVPIRLPASASGPPWAAPSVTRQPGRLWTSPCGTSSAKRWASR
jgi:L-Ala-D/L-Glu epimerase / N-acetyl-D-glutamate racemase